MRAAFFQIDAFTSHRFAGNPAAVMVLDAFPDNAVLQALAAENNLAETAFLIRDGRDYRIRWFTPTLEVPLCGHATLASAAVVMERLEPGREAVVFHSASGPLKTVRAGDRYVMDFPARPCEAVAEPDGLAAALGVRPAETAWDGTNILARLDSPAAVRTLTPNLAAIAALPCAGVVVTAAEGGDFDFVSRYFAPAKGIPEDPVTGGAHCALVPFWRARLGRDAFRAFQASPRGGDLICRFSGERVELEGACVFYLEGEATF
jgi:PhzF family phenazine biosynthesis protein